MSWNTSIKLQSKALITLNSVKNELINVIKEEAMDSTLVNNRNYVNPAICFRSYMMTAKPKGDQKPPQTGPAPGVLSSGPGASTTPPPPAKPTTSPPGAPIKTQTPRKISGGGKVERSTGKGKLTIDETIKTDPKGKQTESKIPVENSA